MKITKPLQLLTFSLTLAASAANLASAQEREKPNILVIWGDDIGIDNVSAYNMGMMGYRTPNIDRIANEGITFTDAYAEQTCTAGRGAFITGQHPFRTGLLTIGMPGSEAGIPDWAPTIGDVMKEAGYATAHFGKNHLGDRDRHLPTNHGFDEFFGNLYHLNAEEEPENYYYPKDPEFRERFGPRGVIKATADGEIEDTGPLTSKRMETVDEEFLGAALDFMERKVEQEQPFFMWFNATRMHVWTHLKPEYDGITGIGLYPDGMVEHDTHVGQLLDKLEELGVDDNTIVMYSTDNGAEKFSWPDGGNTRFRGEKGTNWEGGHRVPLMIKWPGVFEEGRIVNDMIAHNDWLPTLAAAVGMPNIVEDMKEGVSLNNKDWRVHLDGYNFLPFLKGKEEAGPRNSYLYFFADGTLMAVRYGDFKIHFTVWEGDIVNGHRREVGWPMIINLRADPFEDAPFISRSYMEWAGDLMWLFVPVQGFVKEFFQTIPEYPFAMGGTLNTAGLGYQTLRTQEALGRLEELERVVSPRQ